MSTITSSDFPIPGDLIGAQIGLYQAGAADALAGIGKAAAGSKQAAMMAQDAGRDGEAVIYGRGYQDASALLERGFSVIAAPVLGDFDVPSTWAGHSVAYRAGVAACLSGTISEKPGMTALEAGAGSDNFAPRAYSEGFAFAQKVMSNLPWKKFA